MGLPSGDYRECLEVVEIIYSVPKPDKMFQYLCERLQGLIGISTGLLAGINQRSKNLKLNDLFLFNLPEQAFLIFAMHYAGIIEVNAHGRVLSMNAEAKFALNGRRASVIPDPGFSAEPVFLESGTYLYKVRTVPMRWGCVEKTIILEPCPDRHNLRSRLKDYCLTRRQEDVAILAMRGLPYKEIAERLCISEQTVRDHLRDVFEKAGGSGRGEFTAKALGL